MRRRYLVMSGIVFLLGSIFAIITPPAQVSDEAAHFLRASAVSEGHLTPSFDATGAAGAYIDTGTIGYIDSLITEANGAHYSLAHELTPHGSFSHNYRFQPFDNTAAYSPLLYAPSSLAVAFGKLVHLSVSTTFYMSRFANLLAFCLLICLGLYMLRSRLSYSFLLVVLPASLYLAASVSQDSCLIGLAFVVASALMALYDGQGVKLAYSSLCIALFLLVSGKLPYAPLLLFTVAPFLFPKGKERFKAYRPLVVGTIAITMLYSAFWYHVVKDVHIANIMTSVAEAHRVNPALQLQHCLHHPLHFLGVLYRTNFTSFANNDSIGMIGGMFGYHGGPYYMPWIFMITWLVGCVAIIGRRVLPMSRQTVQRLRALYLLVAVAILGTILLVQLALYMQWSPLDARYIFGLHGRYYLPILIVLSGIFPALLRLKQLPTLRFRTVVGLNTILFVPALILIQSYY